MADTLTLKVLTPERVVLEEHQIASVSAHITDGSVGILPHHQPMVAPLQAGLLNFRRANGQDDKVAVMGGMLHTDGEVVTVLADAAEKISDIDVLRAQQAKERAETRIRNKQADLDMARAKRALGRALLRLKLAQ